MSRNTQTSSPGRGAGINSQKMASSGSDAAEAEPHPGDDRPGSASQELELALLAGIVAAAPDSIVSTDMEARFIPWNAGAERMYGYRAEEMQGRSIAIPVPPDHLDELAIILSAITDGTGAT